MTCKLYKQVLIIYSIYTMAKVTYINHLNFIANKRVLADRLLTKKEKQLYIDNGIYYDYNDTLVNNKFTILIDCFFLMLKKYFLFHCP